MQFRRGLTVAAAVAVLAPLGATGAAATSDDAALKRVRAVTAKYHSEKQAIKDGYQRTNACVPNMGYHYVNVNPDRFASTNPLEPGALLYAPRENGKGRVLIGVEYFVVDEDQDVSTRNEVAPSMFGTQYDGPMPGHGGSMPVHYDLHAYVWTDNPAGVLATSNRNVVCPPA